MLLVHYALVRTPRMRRLLAQAERTYRAAEPCSDGDAAEDRGPRLSGVVQTVRASGRGLRTGRSSECGDIPGGWRISILCVVFTCVVCCVVVKKSFFCLFYFIVYIVVNHVAFILFGMFSNLIFRFDISIIFTAIVQSGFQHQYLFRA